MLWNYSIPDIFIRSIEKGFSLSGSSIFVDIGLDGDIFLRGECSCVPLPATSIGREISIEEMIVHPLARSTPVSSTHIASDPCYIHAEMIMHISRLVECLDTEVESLDTSFCLDKCRWHSLSQDSLLVESDISHHPICPESLPYTEKKLSPSEFFQELLYLMRLVSSREHSDPYISYRDESSRYIGREHRDMSVEMIAISTVGYRIDRIDHLLYIESIRGECVCWDFHISLGMRDS